MNDHNDPRSAPPNTAPHNCDLAAPGPASCSCTFFRTEEARPEIITCDNTFYFDIDGNTATYKVLTNTSDNDGDFATLKYVNGADCWTLDASQGTWVLL